MLEQHTTMTDILAKVREIIADEPPLDTRRQMALRAAPDRHVVKRDVPVKDAVIDAADNPSPRSETSKPQPLVSPDTLETVFASAIREGISSPVQSWVNSHQADLIRALSPMIRRWMDNQLPKLVESVLKEEVGRAIGKTLHRSA